MDNRTQTEIAYAESPQYAALCDRVGELERGQGRIRTEVDDLEREAQELSNNIAAGQFQNPPGTMTRAALEEKLRDVNSARAGAQTALAETSRALVEMTARRDQSFADFLASR